MMRAGWSSKKNQLGIGEALSRAACRGTEDDIHLPGLLSENHLCDGKHLRRDGWLCLHFGEYVLGQIQSLYNEGEHHVCKRKNVFRDAKDPRCEGKSFRTQKMLSAKEKMLSVTQKMLSAKEKMLSGMQKILSAKEKIFSVKESIFCIPDSIFFVINKIFSVTNTMLGEGKRSFR